VAILCYLTGMTVHWIIQRNHGNPFEAERLREIVGVVGHRAHSVDLVPFNVAIPPIREIPMESRVVCHGPGFVPRALAHPGWRPGIFFDEISFRWSAFQAHWPDLMLSHSAILSTVGQVRSLLAQGTRMFVRPDADNKAFESGVHDAGSFARAIARSNMPDGSPADDAVAVIVAPPVEIESEYRIFVVDGEIVAASSYRHLRKPNIEAFVPNTVIDLALSAASIWMPAPAACIDVAISPDGTLGIVEANCVNAARFYGANVAAVVESISSYVERA
jgi:hypothetical protein